MARKQAAAQPEIRDRIVGLVRVKARDLVPHPLNWREHPPEQAVALRLMLEGIGYADTLKAYRQGEKLVLFDGHLRRDMTPDQEVPVLVTDLTEEEAATMLAAGDPIGAMAETNQAVLAELLQHGDDGLLGQLAGTGQLLAQLLVQSSAPHFDPTGEDGQRRLDERACVVCPECGHEFVPNRLV